MSYKVTPGDVTEGTPAMLGVHDYFERTHLFGDRNAGVLSKNILIAL